MQGHKMADFPKLISYQEAINILNTIPLEPLGTQQVHFKNALNRILAQDIKAPCNVPAYPTAAMDGYAIMFEDLELLATQGLAILPPNKAGNPTRPNLTKAHAIKTFTGSIMPLNADTLVIVEHITLKDDRIFLNAPIDSIRKSQWIRQVGDNYKENEILLHKGDKIGAFEVGLLDDRIFLNAPIDSIRKSQWIRQVGDNYKENEILLHKGDKIGAFEVGLLAELNQSFVQVYQKAKVGILCVGDEIIEVGQDSPHQNVVRSVNTHLLESLLLQMGQEPIIYPITKDDKTLIKATYTQALKECDMLLTTGGMSMGDYDYTQEVMQELSQIHFKGVRLKPGKPVAFGSANNTLILGLPGFPNSCAVTFLLFGTTLLARLHNRIHKPLCLEATLLEECKRSDSRLEFRACEVFSHNGKLSISFASKKSIQSSMVNNLTRNTALAILEENGSDLPKGAIVQVIFLHHLV